MTEEQRLCVEEKSHLRPSVTVHEPSGYIQVRAVGRDGGMIRKSAVKERLARFGVNPDILD